ncbi:MAG TPA: kynureninase [Ktedonobacterales bacterium]|jgi:kynureninase
MLDRREAQNLDAADPLRALRRAFVIDDPELIYLDGNSLGRLPKRTARVLREAVRRQWGERLIRGWDDWIDLPQRVGDQLAEAFLGARPGEVAVSDSTTVNFYKLASAALDARPGRRVILTSDDNFPTDRYVLESLAASRGMELRPLKADPGEGLGLARLRGALGPDVALVSLSHVNYRSGALEDMAAITAAAHKAGALALWDLCHSVGAVPIDLEGTGADLAVGCTYKYLSAGPGAPAFLYVRRALQDELRQPIWGWFGQRDQFEMGPRYEPTPGIGHFLAGTPTVFGVLAIQAGVEVLAEVGIEPLRAKAVALGEYLIQLWEVWLRPLGFELGSPRDAKRRGAHVALRHPDAYRICQALIAEARVLPDFRTPDAIRLGPAPAYTRFVDVWDALDRMRDLVASGAHERFAPSLARVT